MKSVGIPYVGFCKIDKKINGLLGFGKKVDYCLKFVNRLGNCNVGLFFTPYF